MDVKDHSTISYTAIICAKSLAEHTKIPYTKEIYDILKQKKLEKFNYHNIFFKFSKFIKGLKLLNSFLEARYLSIGETLKKLRNPPVIELASGLSPRGISYPNTYIETDLKNMIKPKKKILSSIPKRKDHILIPLNILNKKQLFKTGDIYKKHCHKKSVAIIHAGLWSYLTREEQKIARNNIKNFLKKYSPNGYWISPDFRPKSIQKNLYFKFFRKGITKKTGRSSTRFKSDKEIISFMQKAGLKVKIQSNNKIINKLNTKIKFNLNPDDIKRQTSNMKIYIIQLKKCK